MDALQERWRSEARTNLYAANLYRSVCDDIIAEIEYIHVLGVSRRDYDAALEMRQQAVALEEKMDRSNAYEVWSESGKIATIMGQAMTKMLHVETVLFPDRPPRVVPEIDYREIMKACLFCAEPIREGAAKCPHCGEWIDPVLRQSQSAEGRAMAQKRKAARGAFSGLLTWAVITGVIFAVGMTSHLTFTESLLTAFGGVVAGFAGFVVTVIYVQHH